MAWYCAVLVIAGGMTAACQSATVPASPPFLTASAPIASAERGLGVATIEWSTGDSSPGEVCVSTDHGPERLFARAAAGRARAEWITLGSSYEFRLYRIAEPRELLARTIVDAASLAEPSGNSTPRPLGSAPAVLTATPNPVPRGSGRGSTRLEWDVGTGVEGRVEVSKNAGPPALFASGVRGSAMADWIQSGATYEFRLYGGASGHALATLQVTRGERGGSVVASVGILLVCALGGLVAFRGVAVFPAGLE
jgi:hypothetical protein